MYKKCIDCLDTNTTKKPCGRVLKRYQIPENEFEIGYSVGFDAGEDDYDTNAITSYGEIRYGCALLKLGKQHIINCAKELQKGFKR